MKKGVCLFCLVTVIGGFSFFLYQNDSSPSKVPASRLLHRGRVTETLRTQPTEVATPPSTPTKNASTTSEKKKCGCCRSTLEKIRQKRKELEIWAREMISTHGYEAGMKRVTAKSPTLAKRIQNLLEKEKNSASSVQEAQ